MLFVYGYLFLIGGLLSFLVFSSLVSLTPFGSHIFGKDTDPCFSHVFFLLNLFLSVAGRRFLVIGSQNVIGI